MTLVRFILVLGERLVPASARNRWREEWEAELESMGRGSGPRPGTISLTVAVAMDVRAMRRAARISPEPRVRGQWFDVTRQDLLYAMRSLKRVPGFTLAAVATLAIGIGINTAIFSVVKTVLLEPPPFPRPDELVGLYMTTEEVGYGVASPAAVRHWQTRNDLFVDVAAHRGVSFNLRGSGDPERPHGAAATPSIFSVLGVRPFLGRTLVQGDDAPGADPVVVIAHGLWQRQFGSDSSVIGTTLNLDGEPHTLVGVMPPGHGYPFQAELWIPLILSSETWQSRGSYFLGATARLRPDVTTEQATTALSSAGSEYSPPSRQFATRVQRIHDAEVGWMAKNLWLLFAAVGLVLLIACANVANLALARSPFALLWGHIAHG